MTTTEDNVAAQAGDEPMQAVVTLAWKWHDAAVADGFAASEPAQELFALLGWPDRGAQVSPRATADVERDAARYQFMRNEATGNFLRFCPYGAPDEIDKAIDAILATTKPGD